MPRLGLSTGMGVLIALAILVGAAGAGDKDIAELLYGKGEKAYRKKAYKEAVDHYRRALEEHSPYPEAAYRLGMALEKLGNGKEALEAFLLAEQQFGELEKLTRKQQRSLASARKCIARLGAGYGELKKIDDEFVKQCVALCRKHFNSSPAWAKKACETALAIDPKNKLALGFREKLGSTALPSSTGGLFEPCIVDDRLEGWDPGVEPPFTCSGGVMTITPTDKGGHPNFVKKRLTGEFEFRAKFRPLTWEGKLLSFALIFGHKPDGTLWSLGVDWNNEFVLVKWDSKSNQPVKTKIISEVELKRWYQIHVKVKDGKLTALLDGKVAFEYDGGNKEAFDGAFGVLSQEVKVEIKEVEVRR
jgi:hypothetical protein